MRKKDLSAGITAGHEAENKSEHELNKVLKKDIALERIISDVSAQKIFDERKSNRSDFDCQFCVYSGNESFFAVYEFFYKVKDGNISVLGKCRHSTTVYSMDEDERDKCEAEEGKKVITSALNYLEKKYSKNIIVEPKEYCIGRYLVWSFENETNNYRE